MTRRVLLDDAPDAERVLAFVDQLAAAPETAIGLAIWPGWRWTPPAFGTFAEQVGAPTAPAGRPSGALRS